MAFLMSGAIPENIRLMMSAADRKAVGKGAMTQDEAVAKAVVKLERELHDHVVAILRGHRDICVLYNRTDKKSTAVLGTPDLIFAVAVREQHGHRGSGSEPTFKREPRVCACAWELKVGDNDLDPDQVEMKRAMTSGRNAWTHRVIRSVDEALAELRAMGL